MGVQLRDETFALVKKAAAGGCSLCRMTLKTITPENVLRDFPAAPMAAPGLDLPADYGSKGPALDGDPLYPVEAQRKHISQWHMKGHGPWASQS